MTLPADTLPAMADYLAQPKVLEHYRHHDLAVDFHDEIRAVVDRARAVIDSPHAADADVLMGRHDCGGKVIAHVPSVYSRTATATCTGCDATWSGEPFRSLGRDMRPYALDLRPVWVSTREAGETLGVSDGTVRWMVRTGRLHSQVKARGRRRVLLVSQADVLARRDRRLAG